MSTAEQTTMGEGEQVTLGPELTVRGAPEIQQTLLAALADGGAVALDLGAVREVDLTGLQLLCAAHRWAAARGGDLRLSGAAPAVAAAARRAGFTRSRGCRPGCFWAEGGG